MRKVTEQIKKAFDSKTAKKVGNTRTDGDNVWLHGNLIVKRNGNDVLATLAGWNTTTTRERVRGITGLNFHQVDFEARLDNESIGSHEWVSVKNWNKYMQDKEKFGSMAV